MDFQVDCLVSWRQGAGNHDQIGDLISAVERKSQAVRSIP